MRFCALMLLASVCTLGCVKEKESSDFTGKTAAEKTPMSPGAMAFHPQPEETAQEPFNTEDYDRIYETPFLAARDNPFSTFSIDVDTASYSNVRRYINNGSLPPKDAVQIEEMVNYFLYDYPPPEDDVPFSAHVEVAPCPWKPEHRLARIALKGREIPQEERPAANLVFLLDVSGSMEGPNKLPLLKAAMKMLVQNLSERDRVAIVVYAGNAGLVLPSTSCENKAVIYDALDQLHAGGSTAGGEGILLAYRVAEENFTAEEINRVILCTDGDFNVGVSDDGSLTRLIEEKARSGVFLTVLGFGTGNLKGSRMEKLADHGNGNYGYVDTLHEARKLLVEQMGGTLVTIAKDVKIQVDFNPAHVGAYRLIGYENRLLQAEDFRDDTKDAGEIGAGHTVTAFYELVPPGKETGLVGDVEPSKYQRPTEPTDAAVSDELFTVRLRYKHPKEDTSQELSFPVTETDNVVSASSGDFQFASAVACFGMLLRESQYQGDATYDLAIELAIAGKGEDRSERRGEFIQLAELAKVLPRR
ncbi:MAG TPA: VWA domain-containing protein [Thermoguttaceae bacterium]|nr:VWA domain-containing protein [Thermoguttaceae bacterium]